MTRALVFRTSYPLLIAAALLLPACVDDDETVNPVLDAAFLGYSNPATRQTTCGNCHVTKQRSWVQTAHARAWDDLQGSGNAQAFCAQCHTTGGFGNAAADSAGYLSANAEGRRFYQDVQCESCHGPGGGHVSSPDDATPLSTISADTASTIGCGTCHSGEHTPFVEEWQASRHGRFQTATAGRADCAGCHEGRAVTLRFDPDAKFIEQGSSTNQAITCAVCHDPHGGPNGGQLRRPIDVASLEENLCMSCHARRFAPDPTSSRGAHSAQGPMYLGEAGWIPQNFAYDNLRQASSHGPASNPRMCATCHVENFTVTDATTGNFLVQSVGHEFAAIPCVDANGQPTGAASCLDTERRWNACVSSGCHATANAAMGARTILGARLNQLADVLWRDIDGDNSLDALPVDSGLLAQVKQTTPGDFSATGTGATIITVGEGVWFNTQMVRTADASLGVHNPFYAEALLLASTQALRAQYTYLPAPRPAEAAQTAARARAIGLRLP